MSIPKLALSDLKTGKTWPVYFLYGEEPFKIHEFVSKMAETLLGDLLNQYDIDRIDGSQSTGAEILNAIQSSGLFASSNKKIVLVDKAGFLKEVEELQEVLASVTAKNRNEILGENIMILISESIDGRKKFHQWLKKNNHAIEFKKATDQEMLTWVEYLSKKMKIKVNLKAAQMLSLLADGSLYRLKSEIEKAWLHSGAETDAVIDEKNVEAVSSQPISHEMVDLVTSFLMRKKTRALILAEKLIRTNEDALGFVGFVNWALKNPKWVQMNANRSLTKLELNRILKKLLKLDERLKSTATEGSVAVEEFILNQALN